MTWGVCRSVSYLFAFSYCSWGSQGKNTEVVCHSLLQWTTFCQTSPLWLFHLGWLYTAWLTVSLSYTKLWSMWSVWLVFYDCGFHSVCPLMKIVGCESFLIGGTGCGENWILLWWARTSSVNLYSNCLLMCGAVFPPCSLAWGQTMIGVHCWYMPPLKMPVCLLWGHRFFLLGPGVHKVLLCLPRVYFSSSIIKSHWPSKSDLLGVLSPFSGSTGCGLWKSVWALELLQQCNNFFGIIVLQFVGHLLSGSAVELMTVFFKNTYAICCISQVCCSQSTCPRSRPLWPMPLQETLTHSKAGLAQALLEVTAPSPVFWCTQGFVFTLQMYLEIEIKIFKTRICVFSWKSQKLHISPWI